MQDLPPNSPQSLAQLLQQVRQCRLCAACLPHGPRPVVVAHSRALSQKFVYFQSEWKARVQGAVRRKYRDLFKSSNAVMGFSIRSRRARPSSPLTSFCLLPMEPGKGKSGDLPPRPECADNWHAPILTQLPNIQLTLLIGQYAQRHYLANQPDTLTARVDTLRHLKRWPDKIPLPHPSPRNQLWLKRHPWFEQDVIPRLQQRIGELL